MSHLDSISLIVAASTNNVIGVAGGLPWHLSDDLKRFKALTMGKPIIMGRKTFESIGRALPGRQNIVITSQAGYKAEGCDVVSSTDAAIEVAGEATEKMIIGGGEIYRLFLPIADRIYLTRVAVDVSGDTLFPELDANVWQETDREAHQAGEGNDHDFVILTYSKVAGT
ncbi:MAG: dihydrofolate reductase [Woeseiaceae bacterium]